MSPAELLEQADLAGEAYIVSVRKADDDHSPHIARLRFNAITKGKPRRRRLAALLPLPPTVDVKMPRIKKDKNGDALPGQWSAGYRAGDRIMTHLVWNEEMGGYTTLAWNAVWQIPG